MNFFAVFFKMSTCSTFVDVLLKRYSSTIYYDNSYPFQVFVLGGLSPQKSESPVILPPSLSMNGLCVRNAGSEKKIHELCHSVEELDLAANCIRDIDEIVKIVKWMPNLRFLNLSENDLSQCYPSIEKATKSFLKNENQFDKNNNCHPEKIKELVLNNTQIPWEAVELLLDVMPSVVNLHLSLNDYSSVEICPTKSYSNVRHLFLSGNPKLNSWDDVETLRRTFPYLESLTMADCSIGHVPEFALNHLEQLSAINISNWPIKSWSCVDRLSQLEKLITLRCAGIPILEELDNKEERRYHLIARLPQVRRLNGGDISHDEREFAERAFIRHFLQADRDAKCELDKPIRFYQLYDLHGHVEPFAEVDFSPPQFAKVRIIFNDLPEEALLDDQIGYESLVEQSSDIREFDADLNKSVKYFRIQLGNLFSCSPSNLRVFYIDREMSSLLGVLHIEELRFAQKKLYTYSVQDGDEFLVEVKLQAQVLNTTNRTGSPSSSP